MHTHTVEEIVKELCAQEADFAGHEEEVRTLVVALKEAQPAAAVDSVFVSQLREKLLAHSRSTYKHTPSPYALDWTAWIVRLAPVGAVALLLLIVLDGTHILVDSPLSQHSKNFVYPPAASHDTALTPNTSRLGVDGTVIAEPAYDPAYGGSADMFTSKEMPSEPMIETAPRATFEATSSPSREGEVTTDPTLPNEEPVQFLESSDPKF